MTYREMMENLKISESKFREVLRKSTKIKIGSGNHNSYTQNDLKLIKEYLIADESIKIARKNLGFVKRRENKYHLPKNKAER